MTAPRRRKKSTKYSRRDRDLQRMAAVKTMACAVRSAPIASHLWQGAAPDPCRGVIEAHHAGVHGLGQKPPDDTVIALCRHHHRSITGEPGGRGCFDGWPRGTVKAWELACVEIYRAAYAELCESGPSLY